METAIHLDELCRFCLSSKSSESFKIFFELTEHHKIKFEEVTCLTLPLSNSYPTNVCSDCSDHLENFHFYKNQLIRKQSELEQFLKLYGKIADDNDNQTVDQPNQDIMVLEDHDDVIVTTEELSSDTIYLEEVDDEQFVEGTLDGTFSQIMSDVTELDDEPFDVVEEMTEVDDIKRDCFSPANYEFLEAAESDADIDRCSSSAAPKRAAPRHEDVKYEKVAPTLVLTPNFLKAREKLKRLPKDINGELTEYMSATLVSDAGEQTVFICSNLKCKAEFSSEEEMKLHLVDHKFNALQQCEYCPMRFKTRHFYEKHIDSVHNDSQFVCQVCGKVLNTQIQYRSHMRNHDHTRKYQCPFEDCNKAFRVKHHLTNHLRVHLKDSPFACTFDGCTARFRQKHALTIHLRKHTGEFKVCDNCKSPFVTQFLLNKHLEKCNGTYKPLVTRSWNGKRSQDSSDAFKCPIEDCFGSYKAKITLEKHITNDHQIEITPTMCVMCCQEFDSQQSLKSHVRDHLPFSCRLCGVSFRSEDNMNSHMSRSHEKDEVRLHGCQQCSAAFKRAEHLKSHINYKHSTAQRPYSCDCCSYKSHTRQDLSSHMKKHMKVKERDFTCRMCNFAATKLGTIKSHLKTVHHTEHYYFCYSCSQGFKYNQEFTQHQKGCLHNVSLLLI